jgi:Zn-dependent protease with chaperone function
VNTLSFALSLGAIAAPVAWLVSAASWVVLPVVRRCAPVARAELAAWLALLPALAALVVVAAVSVPSLRYGLGLGPDHCLGHEHHAHVCFWHGSVVPAWLALLGAVGWAATVGRLAHVVVGLVRTERVGAALAALADPHDGVHVVPATRAVCHAVGVVRPRVVVSRAVVDALSPRELQAVVAHERAHVDRADARWSAALTLAACAAPLTGDVWLRVWRQATEEVADDVAAGLTDGPTVAGALVAVARLQRVVVPGLAFGATDLERRVRRLLGERPTPRRGRAFVGAVGMVALAAITVVAAHEGMHHEIEELWEIVAGR